MSVPRITRLASRICTPTVGGTQFRDTDMAGGPMELAWAGRRLWTVDGTRTRYLGRRLSVISHGDGCLITLGVGFSIRFLAGCGCLVADSDWGLMASSHSGQSRASLYAQKTGSLDWYPRILLMRMGRRPSIWRAEYSRWRA